MNKIIEEDARYVIQSLGPSVSKLQDKTVLITGVSGFIGAHLLASLALLNDTYKTSPCKIFGVSRNPQRLKQLAPYLLDRNDITILSADVRTFTFSERSFDFVIHAAAPVDPRVLSKDQIQAVDIIANGTKQILQESVRCKVGRFLYISSGAVYGVQPQDLPKLPEDYTGSPDITNSLFAYGEAKRYAEMLCGIFHRTYSIPFVVARPFTFVGPFQDLNAGFAVTQFIRRVLKGEPIQIEGDGTALRSYCYAADLTLALWKILLEGEQGRVYNIGSEETISILELACKVVAISGNNVEVEVKRKSTPGQKPARYIPDIRRLKSELKFNLKFGLDEALARTIAWARESNAYLDKISIENHISRRKK